MAAVIKEPSVGSPGIAILTSGEIFYGVIGKSNNALRIIEKFKRDGRWIFGIHINGSLHGQSIEIPGCISFILCGDATVDFLRHVKQPVFEWSAEYFVSDSLNLNCNYSKNWDLVVVSRISEAKRFMLTVEVLHEVLLLDSKLRVNLIATYRSDWASERAYVKQAAAKLRPLLNYEVSINAIDSSLFGPFPLSNHDVLLAVAQSRGLLITSEFEGGPRVLMEALHLDVPVYICEDLQSNLSKHFKNLNVVKISKLAKRAALQLNEHLKNPIVLKRSELTRSIGNHHKLKIELESHLKRLGHHSNDRWCLDDLSMRLPGHARFANLQILYDEGLFIDWCEWIDSNGNDYALQRLAAEHLRLKRPIRIGFVEWVDRIRTKAIRTLRKYKQMINPK